MKRIYNIMKREGWNLFGFNKRGVMTPTLIGWIIAVVILSIIILFAVFLRDKLGDLLSDIRGFFRR